MLPGCTLAVGPVFRMVVAVALAMLAPPPASAADCDSLLPLPQPTAAGPLRALTFDDLVRLRDIGPLGAGRVRLPILSVSPDGKRLAFQIRQADPIANRYCLGMVVLDLSGRQHPRLIDLGGDIVLAKTGGEGFAPREAGFAEVITPKWSPDGRWVAYLRRENGVTQVWRADVDGGGSSPVTTEGVDVTDFAWSADSRRIVYSTSAELPAARAERASELLSGFLYDDRYDPAISNRPLVREPVEVIVATASVVDEAKLKASVVDQALLQPAANPVPGSLLSAVSSTGAKAWVSSAEGGSLNAPTLLTIQIGNRLLRCTECDGVSDMWWSLDGSRFYFLKREQVRPRLGFYRWIMGEDKPRRVLLTEDALVGCVLASEQLICADEGATRPRRLVSIALADGRVSELFDPNPEFRSIRLGKVQRLRWKNAFGLETFGDLVYPPDYQPGKLLPLIVVGYDARGFARGGTGDDYPIQAYAARGYVVLSYERPPIYGFARGARTLMEAAQIDRSNWADYRNVLSSIETEVRALIDQGIVDPARIGLTGFSNGASVAQYAMVNSQLFKAYAVSHCCEDPVGAVTLVGPAGSRWLEDMGYPRLTDPASGAWDRMSIRLNAAQITAPVLMQLPDDEYLGALEGLTALKEKGRPVELYIFANEHHVKWQPAHRSAEYQRSLDWFDFWLRGVEDPAPQKVKQYQRWRALRETASKR
jgi:dipeptidyl aminopeptidase/acylaminoacyl peptidase